MPSGKTHDRVTLWGLPWVTALALFITRHATLTLIITGAYLFSGLMFGPDLDIYSIQYKRWGWLRWLWIPYQRSIRHRSRLSHGPFIGTTLRLAYFAFILLLIGIISIALLEATGQWTWDPQATLQWLTRQLRQHYLVAIALFVGLELGAMSHAITDRIGSRYKRQQREQKKAAKTAKHPAAQTRKSKLKP